MSSTVFLPFLYQTRTIQRVSRPLAALSFVRQHQTGPGKRRTATQNSRVPFEWGPESNWESLGNDGPEDLSTITPSEAEVFRGIFDDIASARVNVSKKEHLPLPSSKDDQVLAVLQDIRAATSMGGQAPGSNFRTRALQRFPASLREAAAIALGQYTTEPVEADDGPLSLGGEELKQSLRLKAEHESIRSKERKRVAALMRQAATDEKLWKVMLAEVFSMPGKLGIAPLSGKKVKPYGDGGMDIHGPLYATLITDGLEMFNSTFNTPSMFAFEILRHIKMLGLPSYILGVSTAFYNKLAWMYWNRCGDPISALDMVQEMIKAGLSPDVDSLALLRQMRQEIDACTWGSKGDFVMGVMTLPPYDAGLMQRLDQIENLAQKALKRD